MVLFPRSHSTGHSLIQPEEKLEHGTIHVEVASGGEEIDNEPETKPGHEYGVLAKGREFEAGYRAGGEGSSRGKSHRRMEKPDQMSKSKRWAFFTRAWSMKSPKVAANNDGEGTSSQPAGEG
ncbi:E3 ubiquitin-protein ligase ATL9-like [Juglans regia]|uniref:E3 ubiquitin-protein ligase ATL9-like n=1 Tax=Juglans regia TaxID=51240 RepID=A0A6P9EPS9_JUGRE|nr:E3 ubiquitin-protein ligase ATL9-like [Juglans regia]